MLIDREIEATLRLLSKSLKYRLKISGLASSRWAPPSPLASDLDSSLNVASISVLNAVKLRVRLILYLRLSKNVYRSEASPLYSFFGIIASV